MFRIDQSTNRLRALAPRSFSEMGFNERGNLQEWIAHHPEVFGEKLLIIQKEFAEFQDTRERLDLLALDVTGNLVIIENKLDDTGRDVVWQALKYASYCSTLTRDQIVSIYQSYLDRQVGGDARKNIEAFFESDLEEIRLNQPLSQRLFLIAGNFRKEVTSTALWLSSFGIKVQCYLVSLYADDGGCLLNFSRILPPPSAEDYTIRLAEKTRHDASDEGEEVARYALRKRFWRLLLDRINEQSPLFQNISPTKDNSICATAGVPGTLGYYFFRITGTYARVEFLVSRTNREDAARATFDRLAAHRQQIEAALGEPLGWEVEDGKSFYRVVLSGPGNIFDEEQWPEMIERLSTDMLRLHGAIQPVIEARHR